MPDELDLDALEVAREIARRDKADLFDFYNANWDNLVAEIERLRNNMLENDNWT